MPCGFWAVAPRRKTHVKAVVFQPYELLPHVPALLAKTSFTRSSLAHVFGFHCFYHCCLRTEAYRFRSYAFIGTNPFHVGLETFRGAIHFTIAVLPIPGTNFRHRVVEQKTNCPKIYEWSIIRKHGADLFIDRYTANL